MVLGRSANSQEQFSLSLVVGLADGGWGAVREEDLGGCRGKAGGAALSFT